jgi:hypothetical protein
MTTNEFEEIMAQHSDTELFRIVNQLRSDYQPEAVQAAEAELQKRNLSSDHLQSVQIRNEIQNRELLRLSLIPLPIVWKVLTSIKPGLLQFLLAEILASRGYKRIGRELSLWTLFGFGFWILMIATIALFRL